ncbi:MAG TPA: LysR family transcriptional regulator [Rhodocyclaceae bacterium]|jgi:DNA-binding transcriptional LysR family regulator|nr:LysR family transcriptional regulator [Rhodocyclaceae bacterium]
MKALQDLDIFVKTADSGSLSAAARVLDISPAVASAALKRLETELGAALFVRSTRSLRLTQAGESFLLRSRQALEALRLGREELVDGEALRGDLQLSLPSDLGRNVMLPWLDEFLALHPAVRLRLQLSDRRADVYREPVDVAVRYGELPDSNLVALPLAADCRRVLCASPDYLARHGAPANPQALAGHACLCFMLSDYVHDHWRFQRGDEALTVRVDPSRVADDGDAVRRWALAGQGIAFKSQLDAADDLAAGRLVTLCPDWLGEPAPLYLICADRRQLSPVVQALRTFLVEKCRALLVS